VFSGDQVLHSRNVIIMSQVTLCQMSGDSMSDDSMQMSGDRW